MKRRNFLMNVGLIATASPLLGNNQLFSQPDTADTTETINNPSEYDLDAKLDKPVTAIVIGAGSRGSTYANYAGKYPQSFILKGVSDINDYRKNRMGDRYTVENKYRFGDWTEVFKVPKFADIVIITTPDHLHYAPCMKALEMGYHVLLEKPAAQSEQECINILNQSRKQNRIVAICHVLRYAPYFIELRKLVQSGQIGKLLSIQHLEPIEHIHMSHSYVRGNWRNSKETTPIILSKSCHDLDILRWIVNKPCQSVTAFGELSYFTAKNAPAGSAKRCLDCKVEKDCVFSAKRLYYDHRSWTGVFDLHGSKDEQDEQILNHLKKGNYGRCVFHCDNDQCDHYIMNMKFEDNVTVAFSMEGLTSYGGRFTRIMGTKGDIVGDQTTFTHTDFLSMKKTQWKAESGDGGGHGGGDLRLVRDLIRAVSGNDESLLTSTIEASIESHIMGFKAETARIHDTVEKLR